MKESEKILSHNRLKELLLYNHDTGIFTFTCTRGGKLQGDVAGAIHGLGYIFIMLDGETYPAHRLAWFYCF